MSEAYLELCLVTKSTRGSEEEGDPYRTVLHFHNVDTLKCFHTYDSFLEKKEETA